MCKYYYSDCPGGCGARFFWYADCHKEAVAEDFDEKEYQSAQFVTDGTKHWREGLFWHCGKPEAGPNVFFEEWQLYAHPQIDLPQYNFYHVMTWETGTGMVRVPNWHGPQCPGSQPVGTYSKYSQPQPQAPSSNAQTAGPSSEGDNQQPDQGPDLFQLNSEGNLIFSDGSTAPEEFVQQLHRDFPNDLMG